jgi:hypothetical protein
VQVLAAGVRTMTGSKDDMMLDSGVVLGVSMSLRRKRNVKLLEANVGLAAWNRRERVCGLT